LENHRGLKSSLAFRHLQVLDIDNIYFGDNKISKCELQSVAKLDNNAIALECEINTDNDDVLNVLKQIHTDRPDSSECVIRSQESRLTLSSGSFTKKLVEPCNTVKREIGNITIDNNLYERYAGELQVCRNGLKQDKKVNVIGKVNDDNLFLLPYIKQAKKYYFIETKEY
jgi:uncharacterized protein